MKFRWLSVGDNANEICNNGFFTANQHVNQLFFNLLPACLLGYGDERRPHFIEEVGQQICVRLRHDTDPINAFIGAVPDFGYTGSPT